MADQKNAVKILDISGDVWMSGMSLHPTIPIGGAFKIASDFDPFEKMGIFIPSLVPTQDGAATIALSCAFNVGWQSGGVSYFYAFGNAKLYQVATSSKTVTDKSSQITGMSTARGAIKFKGKFLYASDSTVKSQAIPVDGSETTVLSGLQTANHVMHVGPDRKCYMTNKQYVARITDPTTTTGNSSQYLSFEDDVTTRDITDDGKHLVIIGDNNESVGGELTVNRCFVGFWNMKSQDLTAYWEVPDDNFSAGERIEDDILVFGRNNIYICNVNSPLRVLMPLRGNSNLSASTSPAPYAVVRRGAGIVLWTVSDKVYGYGRPHPSMSRIFFTPYSFTSGSGYSLFFDGSKLWGFNGSNALFDWGTGSTRQTSNIYLSDVLFKRPYEFSFAKILLNEAMSSVQTVSLQILTMGGNKVVMNSNSFNNTNDPGKFSKVLPPNPAGLGSDASMFQDVTSVQITNTKAEIRSVEVWGIPVDASQDLGV